MPSAQHANVYLRSRRIHVWDMWRTYIGYAYVVYVWSAQHANVYLRSRRIHVWDMWRTYIGYAYVVYVWT
jgi:predicted phosphatase